MRRGPITKPGTEDQEHLQVCQWLRLAHKDVIFSTDGAGIRLTKFQAVKRRMLQSGRGYPDLFIARARHGYHGLYVEIKRTGGSPFLKDGITLVADKHVREQAAVLEQLRAEGYKAEWGIGFDACRAIIDGYLK